jgi:hypothetical protein
MAWFRSDPDAERKLSNPIELSSLSTLDRMEQLRENAIKELEISDNEALCQKCGLAVPLGDKLMTTSSTSGRITYLKRRIDWARKHGLVNSKATG